MADPAKSKLIIFIGCNSDTILKGLMGDSRSDLGSLANIGIYSFVGISNDLELLTCFSIDLGLVSVSHISLLYNYVNILRA